MFHKFKRKSKPRVLSIVDMHLELTKEYMIQQITVENLLIEGRSTILILLSLPNKFKKECLLNHIKILSRNKIS